MQAELTNIFNWIRFVLYLFCFGIHKSLIYLGYDKLYSFAIPFIIGIIAFIPLEKCRRISNIKKELSKLHIGKYLKKRYLVICLRRNKLRKCKQNN
tara:strand:- start:758 stop:1045 length:288 start_codon:yes stop_codon:yes gene_type:complete